MSKQESLEGIASLVDKHRQEALATLIAGLSDDDIGERAKTAFFMIKKVIPALEDDPNPQSRELSLETLNALTSKLRAPQNERELNDLSNAAFYHSMRWFKQSQQQPSFKAPQARPQPFGAKLCELFRRIIKPKPKPETVLMRSRDASGKLVVSGYRRIYAEGGIGASNEMSDQFILDTYVRVATAFHDISVERGERLEAGSKNKIVLKFLELYRTMEAARFEEHLSYELEKYRMQGLRPEYASPPLLLF